MLKVPLNTKQTTFCEIKLQGLVTTATLCLQVVSMCLLLTQELLTGAEYNDKSDVWSVGCILYELCALRPPFHADSHLELVTKVTSGQLERIPACYSDDLFTLICTLLQVNVSWYSVSVSLYLLCLAVSLYLILSISVSFPVSLSLALTVSCSLSLSLCLAVSFSVSLSLLL